MKAIDNSFNQASHAQPYANVIDELLVRYDLMSSDEALTEARKAYFREAIHKGYPLSTCPEDIQDYDADQLKDAAEALPDKKAKGWGGSPVEFDQEDREKFDASATYRAPNLWEGLLPADTTDILIPFGSQNDQSVDDLLQKFIARHNEHAAVAYEEACADDAKRMAADPNSYPKAGRVIEQQQIRIDPEDSSKIQTLDPKKQKWKPGPRLGKFLQDNYQWELFDLIQDNSSFGSGERQVAENESIIDLMNHNEVDCDALLEKKDLRILISSDPQKIAEMSTGQRWNSCMSKGAENYRYINQDISEGSLVAYVVHKDDVKGRYPLMRQLIKPYESNNGNRIYVPARIYGGESWYSQETRQALQQTLITFVDRYNKNAPYANYRLSDNLYADGQATFVNLRKTWEDKLIANALRSYQAGAIKEWMTEFTQNCYLAENGKKGQYGEDPAKTANKFLKKLEHVLMCDDPLAGLPRMFYREQTRSTVGVNANPRDIYKVASSDPKLKTLRDALVAIKDGDLESWENLKPQINKKDAEKVARIAVSSAKPKDKLFQSSEMAECLLLDISYSCDVCGALDYSVSDKLGFSKLMDIIIDNKDQLSGKQVERISEYVTNFLTHTTRENREVKDMDSSSWMDNSYDILENFEPMKAEEKVAEKWIAIMDVLKSRNPQKAKELALEIHGQFTKELAFTPQHRYAASVVGEPTPANQSAFKPKKLTA